ncbi:MAG TPA: aminotransferase class I/II-fold pyridoxal phosphate-dependent enzyme, partial [Chitinophagaceae bacterium]|nr:aminotransferase class I/II-fold pyridoxal phosphate-dependent enzyme [Chitinophagaceae bacterium]
FTADLAEYPNLVVLQTLSKAWGLAALRVGMAFASEAIIQVMNRIKPPYNINQASQDLVLEALDQVDQVNEMILEIVQEREMLGDELSQIPLVEHVFPSDANFLLVKVRDARGTYGNLLERGIVVRDRSRVELCAGCLRITVGTRPENEELLKTLWQLSK